MKGEGGQNAMGCKVVRKEHVSIKDTLKLTHRSNEDSVCSPNHIYRTVYKYTSELGTASWCPL